MGFASPTIDYKRQYSDGAIQTALSFVRHSRTSFSESFRFSRINFFFSLVTNIYKHFSSEKNFSLRQKQFLMSNIFNFYCKYLPIFWYKCYVYVQRNFYIELNLIENAQVYSSECCKDISFSLCMKFVCRCSCNRVLFFQIIN